MRHIDPREITVREVFKLLQGGIAPRPIALVSTLSPDGLRNLSPFSFFNTMGGHPPTVVFSPSRRQRDGTLKDTYHNLVATKECVIQAVTYAMVQQVSLASTEYPSDVDEFVKSGLTPISSDVVKPPRVAESPFQMECILKQMINTSDQPGAGNLAICEVVRFHVSDDIFKENEIDPQLIDLVGRNSADWYTRASGDAIFHVKKPIDTRGIGYDQIPEFIRNSNVFSANNLGQLGNCERIPSSEEVRRYVDSLPSIDSDKSQFEDYQRSNDYRMMFQAARSFVARDSEASVRMMQLAARCALDSRNDTDFAWAVALFAEMVSRREA